MKELEHLGWCHLFGSGWGPLQSFDLNGTARILLHSPGYSPPAGAAMLQTGNLGVRLCPSPRAQHEERRKMSLQAMALRFGRSGVWDPQHGDSLAPLLLESRDPRCILPKSCLCWGYVSLTEKFVWLLFASETSPVLCSCVLGSGFYLFRQWLHMRGECREDNEAADFGFRLCKAWNWLWGPGSWKWHW